jgi:hypothetical protein
VKVFGQRAMQAQQILLLRENVWRQSWPIDFSDLLRYSFFLGLFPFAGYLCSYTLRGTIWSYWPFIRTTVDPGSAFVYSSLQWILFATFPLLCVLLMEAATRRSAEPLDFVNCVRIVTYSMTPLCLSTLFVGVPFFDRIFTTLGFATFLYLLYYGFRIALNYTIARSLSLTAFVFVLFAFIRELFIFAIGY